MRIERSYDLTVEEPDLFGGKLRVDAFLAQRITELSRSALTGDECSILINGKKAKKSDKVALGDRVELSYVADVFEKVEPEDIELDVLYEDSDMLVINKAQGMVVHPGAGNTHGTIVNALAYRYGQDFIDQMADECDISRPGIVHRLDKDTSGLLLLSNDGVFLHRVISPKSAVEKCYCATVDGEPGEEDVKAFCEGLLLRDGTRCLPAKLEPLGEGRCLVRVTEGKYHQVRRMLASRGFPVKELKRLSIGELSLDEKLAPGEWKELAQEDLCRVFRT